MIPALKNQGLVTTVWKAKFFERIKFLFTGKLYHIQACPNQPMQAVALDFEAPFEKVKK